MKKQLKFYIVLLIFIFLFVGCQKKIDYENTQTRYDDFLYEVNKNKPFTGLVQKFYKNGQIQISATYKNGLLDGKYQTFETNGEEKINQTFKKGFPINGTITGMREYKKGLLSVDRHFTFFTFEKNLKMTIRYNYTSFHGAQMKSEGIKDYKTLKFQKKDNNLVYFQRTPQGTLEITVEPGNFSGYFDIYTKTTGNDPEFEKIKEIIVNTTFMEISTLYTWVDYRMGS